MITTTNEFSTIANGTIRPLALNAKISFTKERSQNVNWFILDQSQLNGADILATDPDDSIQLWDAYEWTDHTADVIGMTWSRSVAFPYNVQSALCDLQLNNTSQKYTYDNESSPLHGYILPKRPMRTYAGFKKGGASETVPVFIGLTQKMPKYSGLNDSTATLTAQDFLSEIANTQLNQTVMLRDVRTDEAIATILDTYGMDSSMYNLARGLNTIPFVVFESGLNAGNILAKLVQAENGKLWLDEKGIIRFEPRVADIGRTAVMTFDENNIIEISPSRTDGIINRVKITSDIRAVQDRQPIFSMANENGYQSSAGQDSYRINSLGNKDIWLSFDDPIWSATLNPVLNGSSDDSHFTAFDLSGNVVQDRITATGYLFADSMKITFTNANNFPVSISFLEIWGEPAKIVDTIKYNAYDDESVEKFGEMILDITDNDYFGSYANADAYAMDILKRRAGYSPTITLKVKGNPALQLGDIIHIAYKYDGDYKIVGINSSITNGAGFTQELTIERTKIVFPFILDKSILDGEDVLS